MRSRSLSHHAGVVWVTDAVQRGASCDVAGKGHSPEIMYHPNAIPMEPITGPLPSSAMRISREFSRRTTYRSCKELPKKPSFVATFGKCVSKAQVQRLREAFERSDTDNTGTLSIVELQSLWKEMFPNLSQVEVQMETTQVWKGLDVSGDGQLSFEELICYITGKTWHEDADIGDLLDMTEGCVRYGRPTTWQEWVWAFVEQSSALEYDLPVLKNCSIAFTFFTQFAIVVSVAVMMVESLPEMQKKGGPAGNDATRGIEAACIGVFTLELLLRAISCPKKKEFWWNGWTAIDFLAILPFYLESTGALAGDSGAKSLVVLRVLRLARLVRVLRVLKMGRHSQGVQVLVVALKRSSFALTWLAAILLMAMILFASLLFSVEKQDEAFFDFDSMKWMRENSSRYPDAGSPLMIQSIPSAMWWAIVTLTTVGYGDIYPVTDWGKVIGSTTMFVGVLVVAFPVTILCNVFQEVYAEFIEARNEKLRRAELKPKLLNNAMINPASDEEVETETTGQDSPRVSLTPFDAKGRAQQPSPLPRIDIDRKSRSGSDPCSLRTFSQNSRVLPEPTLPSPTTESAPDNFADPSDFASLAQLLRRMHTSLETDIQALRKEVYELRLLVHQNIATSTKKPPNSIRFSGH